MNKLKQVWNNVRSSFWFMPSLIVMGSIAFAVALIEGDFEGSDRWLAQWPRLFGAGADGARGMMSTIAGSMMTVVGVTFSMILVVPLQRLGQIMVPEDLPLGAPVDGARRKTGGPA